MDIFQGINSEWVQAGELGLAFVLVIILAIIVISNNKNHQKQIESIFQQSLDREKMIIEDGRAREDALIEMNREWKNTVDEIRRAVEELSANFVGSNRLTAQMFGEITKTNNAIKSDVKEVKSAVESKRTRKAAG